MKILFDARVLGDRMHGIARYCQGLLGCLLADDRENEYLVLIPKDEVRDRFRPETSVRWIQTSIPLYGLAEQILLPLRLAGLDFDLYHSPTFTIPLCFASKGLITLHDLIPLLFPKDYRMGHRLFYRWIVSPAISRVRKVITVSRRSAEDIISLLQVPEGKIVITPNGLDAPWFTGWEGEAISSQAREIGGNYVLFVGNPKPHKNFSRVLAAFEILLREEKYSGKLVAVGISRWETPATMKDQICFLPHCHDADLARLYSRADLLASPSLYEGFGLPVLEAMACGCPVLIGDRGALPEVAGDGGFQVNPYDIRAIKEGMRALIFNNDLRTTLVERGKRRAGSFSWERAAAVMRETYSGWNKIVSRQDHADSSSQGEPGGKAGF